MIVRADSPFNSIGRPLLNVTIVQEIVPHYRIPLFRKLARAVDLTVLTDARPKRGSLRPAPLDGVHWKQANHASPGPFLWQPAAALAALDRKVDVLVLNWNIRRLEQLPAVAAARARGVGTVLWGHGYSKTESPLFRMVRDGYGAAADATLFYAEPDAQAYIARGHDPAKVFVAPNAIDQDPIRAAREEWLGRPDDLLAFASLHGLNPAHTILFTARLEPIKRIDLLLQAFARVRTRLNDAKLVLIGEGPAEPALRSVAGRLGIADAVIFTGPLHDQMAIAPWALNAALAAFPADVGLSILHAFGFGLPLVTHGAVEMHNPEIVALRHEVNGLFFRYGDPADFAAKMIQIMGDAARRQSMSAAAFDSVQGPLAFTLDRMVDSFVHCLESVAQRRGRRSDPNGRPGQVVGEE